MTFSNLRTAGMNRRGRHNFMEIIDSLSEYFEECNVEVVNLARGALNQPRRRVFSCARVLEMLDDFEDDYLISTLDADPEFMRRASYVVRDFTRWLRGQVVRSTAA